MLVRRQTFLLHLVICKIKYYCSIVYILLQFFFSAAYTHFQNFASFFSQIFTHKSKNCTQKMPQVSCKMKHYVQNITNTSQKQTFTNTFALILIPVRFVECYIDNSVLCFAKSDL